MKLMQRWLAIWLILGAVACNQPAAQRAAPTVTAPVAESVQPAPQPTAPPKLFEMPAPDSTNPQAVDINAATFDQLRKMPFIGDSFALKIIQGRPYKRKDELSSRNILPSHVYQKAKDFLIASGSR